MLPSTRELAKRGKKGFVCSMIDHGTRDPWIGVLVTPELKAALQHMKTGTMNVHHGREKKSTMGEREVQGHHLGAGGNSRPY
jgi:hypothetical protein